jgi:DNA-binding GntR family transcriptional regulator
MMVGVSKMHQVQIDRNSPVPLWFQLARELERMISEERLVKGGFLENEIELAEQWQVSRPTLRRAIQELVDSGMLVRQRGVGTQVVNAAPPPRVRLTSLYDELIDAGRKPSTTVIVLEQIVPDRSIADSLGLGPGVPAVHLMRCRSADSQRMAILRTWLRVEDAGMLTVSQYRTESLYSLLRARNARPHFAVQTIGARTASPIDAALLGLPVGAPLLTLKRVVQNITGVPIEVEENVYDATGYSLEMSVMEN